jgi:ribonucleoside-triphosphate reductase (thioredoxin)
MLLESQILSEVTTFMKYSKYIPELQRRESWQELVDRNKNMHIEKYPHLKDEIEEAYKFVYEKKVLPSMRSLQFAGKPIDINNARLYNCCFLPMDHPDAFSEVMFLLLSGTGVGYSVQSQHVEKLPTISKPTKTRRYLVGDSIEGWADAVKVLISAYMRGKSMPLFDFRDVRPKGAMLITSGGKAPGPEPLKDALHNIQKILDRKQNGEQLTTLEVHDINCFIADAVLSGGIRRSAMISLFDIDDEEMLTCKFGNWWETNAQRGRSNNSAVIVRHKIEKEVFLDLWKKIEMSNSGEPGFFFTNDPNWGLNPCAEISLRPFQFCNLTTIHAGTLEDQDDFNARAKAAAFIGTLQASYTNFHYLRDIWKRTTEREALLGVSMTGIASGAVLTLDMRQAASVVKTENERVAVLLGIKKAARATTVKPEGTSSLVLGTSSGIHAWHDDYYIRRVRVGKNESIYKYLAETHPEILEDEFFKPTQQAVISVPQRAPEGAITRKENALDLLDRVGKVWKDWVKTGHRKGENKNNVSVTVTIKPHEWEEVGEWMWNNRNNFTALSVLPEDLGTYMQAPFETISKEEYEDLVSHLHAIDLTQVVELEDNTDLHGEVACGGAGSGGVGCEVT